MNGTAVFLRQYQAALRMLEQAITACPDDLWADAQFPNIFWRVAYHALWFTHLYLHESMETFVPWEGHRENYQHLGRLPRPPHDLPKIGEPYMRKDLLDFLSRVSRELVSRLPAMNLEAPSGFGWLHFDKAELQIYSIRHLQHHTGQLVERLRSARGIGSEWAFG
jgi:hypothetical protein